MLRTFLPLTLCTLLAVFIGAGASSSPDTCQLKLALTDGDGGNLLPGIVRIIGPDGNVARPPELVNRGQGLNEEAIGEWSVLPRERTITVPAGRLSIQAIAGLETELADAQVDLVGKGEAEFKIPLVRFKQMRAGGHVAGNTHLHLRRLSKSQADRYLQEVPLADGLDVVFVSYLERDKDDLEYTSNNYTPSDLAKLSHGHLHLGHGEEHRHNFGSHGEGYGHILLLDIPYLVQPVSVGPGITRRGTDSPPMQEGIDKARSVGGKVIWAHNLFGFEDIPNWITGRVHANNIYDGGSRGSFQDTYYRYLNIGLRVPFSTGTDWFIYDFSRVYVPADRPLTPTEWLDELAAGKSFITNGPLLELTVDERPLGSTIELNEPRAVHVHAKGIGRGDFRRIELVRNGKVIERTATKAEQGHFVAELDVAVPIDSPCWLALRTVPPPVEGEPGNQEPVRNNEFGYPLFSHTSPIYVQLAGEGVFDAETARGLLTEMQQDVERIESEAKFANPFERHRVLKVYEEAAELLRKRLAAVTPGG